MHTVKINDKHHPYIHNSRSISKDKQPHQQQYTSLKNPQQQSQHPQHPN